VLQHDAETVRMSLLKLEQAEIPEATTVVPWGTDYGLEVRRIDAVLPAKWNSDSGHVADEAGIGYTVRYVQEVYSDHAQRCIGPAMVENIDRDDLTASAVGSGVQ